MPATKPKATQKNLTWKQKNALKQKHIKQLATKITQLTKSRQQWRTKYDQLKKSQQPHRLKHHPYCLKLMFLSVILHIQHNVSLRACSAALYEVAQLYGHHIKRISASTIRSWSRRMGHYYLQMQLAAGSYVLIADESILIGNQKLLVLLAVAQANFCRIVPLTMSDVVVLHVESATSWKGADIAAIIQQKSQPPGVRFTYAVSDKGSNLRKAFSLCQLPYIEDVTHRLANEARLLFEQDASFNDFLAQQQLTRAKWALSQYAPYLPPNARKKARFHQLLTSAQWAGRVLAQWSVLPAEVQTELAYVRRHESLIKVLQHVQEIVDSFSKVVKYKGISAFSVRCWVTIRRALKASWQQQGLAMSEGVAGFLGGLDAYLAQSLSAVTEQDAILCCSDVIESMFGKYKYGGKGKQVITDESVKVAAFGRSIGLADVESAMGSIRHKFLRENEARRPPSLTKLRRKVLPKLAS